MVNIGTVNDRDIFYQKYDADTVWSKDFPNENWLLFVIVTGKEEADLTEISRKLIENNACFVCCGGEQGELLHDFIDDDIILKEVDNGYPPSITIITTWHDDIENGLWFSIYAAHNEDVKIDTVVCLDGSENDLEHEMSNLLEKFKQGYLPPDK